MWGKKQILFSYTFTGGGGAIVKCNNTNPPHLQCINLVHVEVEFDYWTCSKTKFVILFVIVEHSVRQLIDMC